MFSTDTKTLVLLVVCAVIGVESHYYRSSGCQYSGKQYNVGSYFGYRYDRTYDRCFVKCCKSSGLLVTMVADVRLCAKYSDPADEPEVTTTSPPPMCYYQRRYYQAGSMISKALYRSVWPFSGYTCSIIYCDANGNVRYVRDAENCEIPADTMEETTTTAPTTATEPTTTTMTTTTEDTTPEISCTVNGVVYLPGQEISRNEIRRVDVCYGRICNENGDVERWENTNCFTYRIDAEKNEVGEEGCTINGEFYAQNALVPIENSPDPCLIAVCEPGYSGDGLVYWNTCEETTK